MLLTVYSQAADKIALACFTFFSHGKIVKTFPAKVWFSVECKIGSKGILLSYQVTVCKSIEMVLFKKAIRRQIIATE